MANTNTGDSMRFENGGTLRVIIGATPYEFLLVESGSVRWQPGLRDKLPIMDRGVFTGQVKELDERVSVIDFSLRVGATTFATLLDLLTPASVSGNATKYTIEIEYAPDNGVNTTQGVRFEDCFMPDGAPYQTGGGGAMDTVSFTLNSLKPKPAFYVPSHE